MKSTMNKTIKLILVCIIFLLAVVIPSYADNPTINISVLPFDNKTEVESYDFLSSSIQNSIYSSLGNMNSINLVDRAVSNKVAEDLGINTDCLNNLSLLLKFGILSDSTIIVTGKYSINEDEGFIVIDIFIYNIAKRKTIFAFQLDGLLDDVFGLIDNIVMKTNEEITVIKDELLKSIEELINDNQPPKFNMKPQITNTSYQGILLEWKTNKHTVSEIYFGTDENFEKDNALLMLEDESKDAVNHYVIIDYDILFEKESLYYFTEELDFTKNIVNSEKTLITKDQVLKILINSYEKKKIEYEKNIYLAINEEKDYEIAYENVNNFISELNFYSDLMDVEDYIKEMKNLRDSLKLAIEIAPDIEDARLLLRDRYFEKAYYKYKMILLYFCTFLKFAISSRIRKFSFLYYEKLCPCLRTASLRVRFSGRVKFAKVKILNIVKENNMGKVISIDEMEKIISKLENAITVKKLIEKGDEYADKKNNEQAEKLYEEALEKIETLDIADLINPDEVELRLRAIGRSLNTKFYINFGIGGFYNNGGFLEGNDQKPLGFFDWQASATLRISRVFSLGLGIDFLYIDVFTKFSVINTVSIDPISSELYIKLDGYYCFVPTIPFDFAIGGSVGYIVSFNDAFGFYADLGIKYDFANALYVKLVAGIVYNFKN